MRIPHSVHIYTYTKMGDTSVIHNLYYKEICQFEYNYETNIFNN